MPSNSVGLLGPLLQYVGTPVVIVGTFAWLFKTLFCHQLSKETETLRSGLLRESKITLENVREQTQKELESLKYGLSRDLEDHKVRFARLHDKRMGYLVALFSQLAALETKIFDTGVRLAITNEPNEYYIEEVKHLMKQAETSQEAFHQAMVYLPKSLVEKVSKIFNLVTGEAWRYVYTTSKNKEDIEKCAIELLDTVGPNSSFPDEVVDIKDKIRQLLGVEQQ